MANIFMFRARAAVGRSVRAGWIGVCFAIALLAISCSSTAESPADAEGATATSKDKSQPSEKPTTTAAPKAEQFPVGTFTDQNGFTYSVVATAPEIEPFVDPDATPPGQVSLDFGPAVATVTNTSPQRSAEFNQLQHDIRYVVIYHYDPALAVADCSGELLRQVETPGGPVCLQYVNKIGWIKPPSGYHYDMTESREGRRIPVGESIDVTRDPQGDASVPTSAGESSAYYWTVYAPPKSIAGRTNMTGDAPPVWYSADGSEIPPEVVPVLNNFVDRAWILQTAG